MKIDFSKPITDLDGKPVEDLTLRVVALNALMAMLPDEQNLPGDQKVARFALAMRVNAGGEVDVSPEDIALMKTLIGKTYGALAVGRAYEILNG